MMHSLIVNTKGFCTCGTGCQKKKLDGLPNYARERGAGYLWPERPGYRWTEDGAF